MRALKVWHLVAWSLACLATGSGVGAWETIDALSSDPSCQEFCEMRMGKSDQTIGLAIEDECRCSTYEGYARKHEVWSLPGYRPKSHSVDKCIEIDECTDTLPVAGRDLCWVKRKR